MQGKYIIIQMRFQRCIYNTYCVFFAFVSCFAVFRSLAFQEARRQWQAALSNIHRHRQKRRRGIVFLLS